FWGLNYFDNSSSGVPRMALINPWDVVPDAGYNPENSAFYDTKGNLTALEAAQIEAGGITNAIDRDSPDYFAQPSSFWWNDANDTYMRATGDEKAIRLDSTYFIEGGFLKAVKMGVRMSERQQEVRDVGYSNWGALSGMRDLDTVNGETGHAAAWLDLNDTPYEVVDWSDFYRGNGTYMGAQRLDGSTMSPTGNAAQFQMVHPSMELIRQYQNWDTLLDGVIDYSNARHWRPAAMRDT